jgi:hypothetical protein
MAEYWWNLSPYNKERFKKWTTNNL